MLTATAILLLVVGVTAIFGGLALVAVPTGEILKLSINWLSGTPFPDYLIPGATLILGVGGASLVAAILAFRRTPHADVAGTFAGAVLVGWIVIQATWLHTFNVLQVFYLALGIAIIALSSVVTVSRRHTRRHVFWLLPIAAALSTSAFASEKRHIAEPRLPAATLAMIRQKMAPHSKQMTELVWSVVFVDYRETERLATAMVTAPRVEVAEQLPPLFFTLQDQLRDRARTLSIAAQTRDPAAVSRAFGQITETCAACHAAYSTAHVR